MRATICAVFAICGFVAPAAAQQPRQPPSRSASSRPSASRSTKTLRFRRARRGDQSGRDQGAGDGLPGGGAVQGGRSDQGRRSALSHRERPVPGRGRAGRRAPSSAARPRKALTEIQLQRAEDLLDKERRHGGGARPGAGSRRAGQGPDPERRGQPATPPRSTSATPISSSPIAGKVGTTNVTKGNVVGPDSGAADHRSSARTRCM